MINSVLALGLLTPEEKKFVMIVQTMPACKLDSNMVFTKEGRDLWTRPIHLGLIRTAGNYRWVPNTTRWAGFFIDGDETTFDPIFEATPDNLDDLTATELACLRLSGWNQEDSIPQPIKSFDLESVGDVLDSTPAVWSEKTDSNTPDDKHRQD
jgi:hypothetical protein